LKLFRRFRYINILRETIENNFPFPPEFGRPKASIFRSRGVPGRLDALLAKSLLTDNDVSFLYFRDLCSAFGAQIHPHLEKPTILELLQEGRRSKGGKTKNVATWATKELRKLKQA
jgi:hypothetical protein